MVESSGVYLALRQNLNRFSSNNHVQSYEPRVAISIESKWDLIRHKLVGRLLEEQDKVLRTYFAQK